MHSVFSSYLVRRPFAGPGKPNFVLLAQHITSPPCSSSLSSPRTREPRPRPCRGCVSATRSHLPSRPSSCGGEPSDPPSAPRPRTKLGCSSRFLLSSRRQCIYPQETVRPRPRGPAIYRKTNETGPRLHPYIAGAVASPDEADGLLHAIGHDGHGEAGGSALYPDRNLRHP